MKTGTTLGAMLIAIALLGMAPNVSMAEQHEEVSNPDVKCLKCHGRNLKKKLEDGETMLLRVEAEAFQTSVHSVIGCTGCHRDVGKGKHPSREPISSRRDYSLKHNQTCQQCHEAKYSDYSESIHASQVEAGNDGAPVCSDCHSAHAIQPRTVYEPVNGEPCSSCHEQIYDAYSESVHGLAYKDGNVIRGDHVQSPICSDCHQSHNVSAAARGDHMVSTCLSCHEVAKLAHEQWLPNAGMHLKSVSCPACHSPDAERRVDLQLYDKQDNTAVVQGTNHGAIEEELAQIDPNGDGLDPLELWKLVRRTDEESGATNVGLRGRMEVTTGVEAHSLAASGEAVRACESCHQGNSVAFQKVTVSISRPDGRKERYVADKNVLNSAISVDSVGGFYAPGGTRIKLLDYLLILALIGGLAVPIGHFTLGRILRKKNKS